MIHVMEFVDDKKENAGSYGFSYESNVSDNATGGEIVNVPQKKRGPGRPSKNSNANTYTEIVPVQQKKSARNEYAEGYADKARMLYGAVAQTDSIYNNIENELAQYRANRSYGGRGRMVSMAELMSAQASMIGTKIQAIRELDNIQNNINNFTLKKMQMDKASDEQNSDKAVMDAYYALVNASSYGLPQIGPPLSAATLNTGVSLGGTRINSMAINPSNTIDANSISRVDNSQPAPSVDPSFEAYKQNLNPVQRKMILSNDPNIKTVVVYDQSTGHKYFDIVNVQTGQSIPGVQRPADFLLDNMRVDLRNGIATNSNVNQTYPLVLAGHRAMDEI